jgi:hypothetical protein
MELNKYKILVYIKELKKHLKLLYTENNKNKYDITLNTLFKAEKENKCDLIYYGLCDEVEIYEVS